MASSCDGVEKNGSVGAGGGGGGGGAGARGRLPTDTFRFSLHLPDDEITTENGPIRMGEETLQMEPIAVEEETLKLLPKSFRPFKSNEEYLQVSSPILVLARRSILNWDPFAMMSAMSAGRDVLPIAL